MKWWKLGFQETEVRWFTLSPKWHWSCINNPSNWTVGISWHFRFHVGLLHDHKNHANPCDYAWLIHLRTWQHLQTPGQVAREKPEACGGFSAPIKVDKFSWVSGSWPSCLYKLMKNGRGSLFMAPCCPLDGCRWWGYIDHIYICICILYIYIYVLFRKKKDTTPKTVVEFLLIYQISIFCIDCVLPQII